MTLLYKFIKTQPVLFVNDTIYSSFLYFFAFLDIFPAKAYNALKYLTEEETMTYRVATEQNLPAVIRVKNEAKARVRAEGLNVWNGDYPMDEMLRDDIRNGWGRVIEDNGTIIAYAALHESEEEYPADTFLHPHLLSFGRVMVSDTHLGRGVASRLVGEMIAEARIRGYAGLGIGVDACNARALRLYTRHGFIREGFFRFTFADLDTYVLYF